MHPLLITVAGVGAELTKKDTPYLPSTPNAIIEEALRIEQAGAHIFHLHIRDQKGKPTLDLKLAKKVVTEIRKKTDLIIQISTGGSINDSYKKRIKILDVKPDMASLTLGSVNFGTDVFLNPLPFIEKLAATMKKKRIVPELEIFDVGMVDTAYHLIKKELLKPPYHFNIILGGPGWLAASVQNLDYIIQKLPQPCTWSASGVGKNQLPMIEYAIKNGGHVRTGLEDNIYLKKGVLAKGNAELVEQVLVLAQHYKRHIATQIEAKYTLCQA
ncbi:3-keto-5-aminohexanoate cleavage protein [bacterium]|nr:3-keto-5-aminohexanoate cleavage protein [bacterium]